MKKISDDPDFLDLLAACHENREFSDERKRELHDRLNAEPELRRELAREIQMAALTGTVQKGEPRWLRLEEKLASFSRPVPTEDLIMSRIRESHQSRPFGGWWSRQMAAGVVAGLFVGLLGAGVVRAVTSPKTLATVIALENGDFEASTRPIPRDFPIKTARWTGDPAEVIEQDGGNRVVRFIETAGEPNLSNSLANACDIYQLVELRPPLNGLTGGTAILELSAALSNQANGGGKPILAHCSLILFDQAPESLREKWPMAIREALATGGKRVLLSPGPDWRTVSASCLLPPGATTAVLHFGMGMEGTIDNPVRLDSCFLDRVKLTPTHLTP